MAKRKSIHQITKATTVLLYGELDRLVTETESNASRGTDKYNAAVDRICALFTTLRQHADYDVKTIPDDRSCKGAQ